MKKQRTSVRGCCFFDASCGVSLYDNRGGPITVNLKNPFIHNPSIACLCQQVTACGEAAAIPFRAKPRQPSPYCDIMKRALIHQPLGLVKLEISECGWV